MKKHSQRPPLYIRPKIIAAALKRKDSFAYSLLRELDEGQMYALGLSTQEWDEIAEPLADTIHVPPWKVFMQRVRGIKTPEYILDIFDKWRRYG